MGVTIKCKKTGREMDVGYFGFFKLRTKVAELVGSEVGEHYKKLDDILDIPSPEKNTLLNRTMTKQSDWLKARNFQSKLQIFFINQTVTEKSDTVPARKS